MRINKYIALHSNESRRSADRMIADERVLVNGQLAESGQEVTDKDVITISGKPLAAKPIKLQTIMLNKPVGYIVSRDGQGGKTVYELLPPELHALNPVGRLDKNSSGLLLFTNDGALAEQLTHPRYEKQKTYEILLSENLQPLHRQMISDFGVTLEDGPSKLQLERIADGDDRRWIVRMSEGRNRQIRRTFKALGYNVARLHRTQFGPYELKSLRSAEYKPI